MGYKFRFPYLESVL
ncbi:MAG: hypothetical protein ACJ704_05205 [Nitrososphaeraceae archaeon]